MMKKPESYEEVSSLIASQLKPGVVTNAAVSRQDLERELKQGSLRMMPFDGGLLLTRQRDTFQRLWFYLQKDACLPDWPQALPTVMEIPMRSRDLRLAEAARQFQQLGFISCFTRQRVTRKAAPVTFSSTHPVRSAEIQDLEQVNTILQTCFQPLTACLPTKEELAQDIMDNHVLLIPHVGVLRLIPGKASVEVRQLAVLPQSRGTGAARALMQEHLQRWGHMTNRLWVRTDFEAALHLYNTLGFEADGWTSVVLLRSQSTINYERNRG